MNTPQEPPVSNAQVPVWSLVVNDMHERDKLGANKYGTRLQSFNGRDALIDSYQEQLDHVVYLRQYIEERKVLHQILFDAYSFVQDLKGVYDTLASMGVRGNEPELAAIETWEADFRAYHRDAGLPNLQNDGSSSMPGV